MLPFAPTPLDVARAALALWSANGLRCCAVVVPTRFAAERVATLVARAVGGTKAKAKARSSGAIAFKVRAPQAGTLRVLVCGGPAEWRRAVAGRAHAALVDATDTSDAPVEPLTLEGAAVLLAGGRARPGFPLAPQVAELRHVA